MKKKKSSKIAVTIVVTLALFVGGYIILTSNGKNITDEEKQTLMEIIDDLSRLDKQEKKELNINDITNEIKLDLAFILATKADDRLYDERYTLKDINAINIKYFDSEVIPEDFICDQDDIALFKYDTKKKEYYMNESHGGHGVQMIETVNLFSSASKKEDVYTVKVKKVFAEDDYFSSRNFYKTYSDALANHNSIFYVETDDDIEKDYENGAKEHSKELDIYVYTFKKKGSNYIFQSVVRE